MGRLDDVLGISNDMEQEEGWYLHVVLLVEGGLVKGTENFIEKSESTLSPDDKSAEVTTRSELKDIQPPHVNQLYTGQVAERLDDTEVLIVHDQGSTTLPVTAVTQFTLTGTQFPRVGDLSDVSVGLESLEESDSLLGLAELLDGGGDDEGDLFDLLDTVSTSEDESGEGRCGQGRDGGKSALLLVHLDVPFAPSLGGGEHATSTAHVTKGSLD